MTPLTTPQILRAALSIRQRITLHWFTVFHFHQHAAGLQRLVQHILLELIERLASFLNCDFCGIKRLLCHFRKMTLLALVVFVFVGVQ